MGGGDVNGGLSRAGRRSSWSLLSGDTDRGDNGVEAVDVLRARSEVEQHLLGNGPCVLRPSAGGRSASGGGRPAVEFGGRWRYRFRRCRGVRRSRRRCRRLRVRAPRRGGRSFRGGCARWSGRIRPRPRPRPGVIPRDPPGFDLLLAVSDAARRYGVGRGKIIALLKSPGGGSAQPRRTRDFFPGKVAAAARFRVEEILPVRHGHRRSYPASVADFEALSPVCWRSAQTRSSARG